MDRGIWSAESNSCFAPTDTENKLVNKGRSGMRESDTIAGIGGTATFPFHDCIGQAEVIFHLAIIPKELDDFENCFFGGSFPQFERYLARIKYFCKKSGHWIGLTSWFELSNYLKIRGN